MNRNRIIYQSLALFTGPTGSGSLTQIQRVQTSTHTETINRENVREFGFLGQIDRLQVNPPTVTLNFEALLVNAVNANTLGFVTDGSVSCIANILSGVTDERNYYIALADDGADVVSTTGHGCFAFGNGFLANATYAGQVGQFPTESYTVDALNYRTFTASSGNVPTVSRSTGLNISGIGFTIPVATTGTVTSASAIVPGDIHCTITDTLGFVTANLHIQSFNIAVPIGRENILQLGTRFAFAKVITFPVVVTSSFNCVAGDIIDANLADKICNDAPVNLTIGLNNPACGGSGTNAIQFQLRNAKLDSTNFSANIGSNATVTFSYSTLLGSATDSINGLFISGISA